MMRTQGILELDRQIAVGTLHEAGAIERHVGVLRFDLVQSENGSVKHEHRIVPILRGTDFENLERVAGEIARRLQHIRTQRSDAV